MQDADVIRIQIETLCQKRPQLAVGARLGQRLRQFHDSTPLVAAGSGAARLAVAVGHEVGVVLGSHGRQISSAQPLASVRRSTEPPISVKVRAT